MALDKNQERLVTRSKKMADLVADTEKALRQQRSRRDRAILAALDAGVSQYRIAREVGITEQAIAKIRANRPTITAPKPTRGRTLAEQAAAAERTE